MKIFLSFLQSEENYPIPAYSFWQHYIKNGITESGNYWVECSTADWAYGLVPKSKVEQQFWKKDTWAKTVDWLRQNPADLFLSYLYPHQIDLQAIKQIQKLGIPCVNFFCDNVREFIKIPKEYGVFDLNWVPEYKAIKMYKKAGYPYINLPMPMWVDPIYRTFSPETFNQVTFIGSKDIQRLKLLEKVIAQNQDLPLALYGSGWIEDCNEAITNNGYRQSVVKKIFSNLNYLYNQGFNTFYRKITAPSLNYEASSTLAKHIYAKPDFNEYNALTSKSMITLGINRYPSFRHPLILPDTYSRLRDIEAPMLGACYLTECTEGLESLYNFENEISVYRTANELIEKIKLLKSESELRIELKKKGQLRALTNHNVGNSIKKIQAALSMK